jgi:hypothetical protein
MNRIQQITNDSLQKRTLLLGDGSSFEMTMYFVPLQYGWFIRELTYLDFTLKGFRICNSLNMLHQFRNQLPFGMACISDGDREPSLREDFSSGSSRLYVLTEEEVAEYTEYITNE